MTRKDYVKIADAIAADAYTESESIVVRQITKRIADVFAADNAKFDRERFYNYIKNQTA